MFPSLILMNLLEKKITWFEDNRVVDMTNIKKNILFVLVKFHFKIWFLKKKSVNAKKKKENIKQEIFKQKKDWFAFFLVVLPDILGLTISVLLLNEAFHYFKKAIFKLNLRYTKLRQNRMQHWVKTWSIWSCFCRLMASQNHIYEV